MEDVAKKCKGKIKRQHYHIAETIKKLEANEGCSPLNRIFAFHLSEYA